MAEFFPPVIFEVQARATEAIAEFGRVNKELALMEKHGILAGGALTKLERAGKLARTTFLGLAGAFGVVAFTSIEALDKVEKAQSNLEVAIKNTGVSYEDAKPAVDAHAQAMKNLGFTYDETYAALSKMTAASGSPKLALDALSAAADLARFKQISLADAGTLLARASIGQAKGLGDLGIAMGKTIPKGASFAQILKMVEDRAGGAAKSFKGTLAGGIAVARANFQDLQVQIGTDLVPTLIKVTDWISKTGIPGFKNLVGTIKNNIGWIKGFGIALGAIWATAKVASFISMIGKLISVMRTLAVAAGIAGVAEAYATGGLSAVAATAALAGTVIPLIAGGAAIYGGFKLNDILNSGSGSKSKPYDPMSGNAFYGVKSAPNLQGKGVKRYDTKTPKPTATVQQNVTVYASNTNDIHRNLAQTAKTGVPIGATR